MIKNKNNDFLLGISAALICQILFGFSYVFSKQITSMVSVFYLLSWRFIVAAVFMLVCLLFGVIKVNLKGKNLKPLFVIALFNPIIYFITEVIGISLTTASESGVLLACIPVASLVMSSLVLHKKPSKTQIIGVLITVFGVAVTVLFIGASASLSVSGYIFLLVSIVSYAYYTVYAEKTPSFNGEEKTFVMLLLGAVIFTVLASVESSLAGEFKFFITLPFKNTTFLIAVICQGIGCSAVAFFLYNFAISKIGANSTSSFTGLATVVSIIVGVLLLKETFTIYQVIGAAIIIIGVYIANKKTKVLNKN